MGKISNNVKILNATPEIPGMTKEEADRILENKLNLQLLPLIIKAILTFILYGFTTIKMRKNYSL